MTTDWTEVRARAALMTIFRAGLTRADPAVSLTGVLPERPKGRCIVVGAGKASAAMASALEAAWPDVALSGLVITRYGHATPTTRIRIVEAAHPVPDGRGLAATAQMLSLVSGLGPEDLVIALISGGGSALLVSPVDGVSLAAKQELNRQLLHSGAAIDEMNIVRSHLSRVKGGGLARAAWSARVVTLLISDVPGDDPATIASGPTIPARTSRAEARAILSRHRMTPPPEIAAALEGEVAPPPPATLDIRMVCTPQHALDAMAVAARNLGLSPLILGDALEGEARAMGQTLAGIALSVARHGEPATRPAVILSGGEGSVTLSGKRPGRGGRNTECLLGAVLAARGTPGVYAIACDSDGIDGSEDAAGALMTPSTLARGQKAGLDAAAHLSAHDSYSYFAALGDLVVTGPTLTNVNDLRAFLVV